MAAPWRVPERRPSEIPDAIANRCRLTDHADWNRSTRCAGRGSGARVGACHRRAERTAPAVPAAPTGTVGWASQRSSRPAETLAIPIPRKTGGNDQRLALEMSRKFVMRRNRTQWVAAVISPTFLNGQYESHREQIIFDDLRSTTSPARLLPANSACGLSIVQKTVCDA